MMKNFGGRQPKQRRDLLDFVPHFIVGVGILIALLWFTATVLFVYGVVNFDIQEAGSLVGRFLRGVDEGRGK